jgi:hypothetical protein
LANITLLNVASLFVTSANLVDLNVSSNMSVSGAFTSNALNTTFYYDTLTVPFINFSRGNVSTLNVTSFLTSSAPVNVASLNVVSVASASNIIVGSGVLGSNLAVFSGTVIGSNSWVGVSNTNPGTALSVGGQITSIGNTVSSNYGTCPPLTYRQGGPVNSQGWATPGTTNRAVIGGSVNWQCGTNNVLATATGAGAFTCQVTFPLSYTSNPCVFVTSYGITGNIYVASITNTTFNAWTNAASVPFGWNSIGV